MITIWRSDRRDLSSVYRFLCLWGSITESGWSDFPAGIIAE
jgi:hypothetical protein